MTIEAERLEQLERNIPDIWDHHTYLYVGANENRFHFRDQLEAASRGLAEIDILEIDHDRCVAVGRLDFIRNPIWDDVVKWAKEPKHPELAHYDVIIWSHGPTCVETLADAADTIRRLEEMCGLLVIMCPWGKYPEVDYCKVCYDVNKFAMYPEYFVALEYEVSVIGEPNTAGSNILAWRKGGL